MLRSSIPNHIQLKFELAEDLPSITADPTQIQQIIMNFCQNSSEAIGDRSGTIIIRTARMHISRDQIHFHTANQNEARSTGEYVIIEVEDDGDDIDPATEARIFEPFFSTRFTGRGLGLSACMGIASSHAGGIQCINHPGGGVTMRACIPVGLTQQ